jgi:hypothetical protein
MTGMMESNSLCETLYDMIVELAAHNKSGLPEIIRYSYILSLQTYIENYESYDYGRCEEYEAIQDTFCLDFFEWKSVF